VQAAAAGETEPCHCLSASFSWQGKQLFCLRGIARQSSTYACGRQPSGPTDSGSSMRHPRCPMPRRAARQGALGMFSALAASIEGTTATTGANLAATQAAAAATVAGAATGVDTVASQATSAATSATNAASALVAGAVQARWGLPHTM